MDSIKDSKETTPFPFESLRRFSNFVSPKTDNTSEYTAQSFDNRGKVSSTAAALRARLGYFQKRLSSNSFLSQDFSWIVKTARSSLPEKLLAKADSSALDKSYSIETDRLATGFSSISDRLVSDARTTFSAGTYTYDITIGGSTFSVDIEIETENGVLPTNHEVLQDIERSINSLGIDATAVLNREAQKDYQPYREGIYKNFSYLTIESDDTGEGAGFTIADSSGDLIETLGLDRIRQHGTHNLYRVNGEQSGGASNEIDVETGQVAAYLLGTTEPGKNIGISVKQGRTTLTSELNQIISDYNDLIEWINDSQGIISPALKTALFSGVSGTATDPKTIKLEETEDDFKPAFGFETLVRTGSQTSIDEGLSDIGLTLNNDGTLSIDESFKTAVSSDLRSVYDALAGTRGFFTKVSGAIDKIHGTNENGYVYSKNSILSYSDQPDSSARSIYTSSSSSLINFFA